MSSYDFEIRHRPGKKNCHADAISRSTHLPAPTEEEEKEPDEYVSSVDDRDTAFSRELIIEAQTEDTVLQKVRERVADRPPSKDDLRSENERAYAQLGVIEDDYVEKIVKWPVPRTVKELNTFLGFVGYYRSFIEDFSRLTNEMNDQKKRKKLDWTTVMAEKFGELKLKFSAKPIRAYPRYDLESPFEVSIDFSAENLGAVLSQVQEGQERMIAGEGSSNALVNDFVNSECLVS